MTINTVQSKENVAKTLGIDKLGGRFPLRKRLWIVAIAVVAGLGLWLFGGTGHKPEPVQYATQPARQGNLVVTVSATGTLQPIKKVDVGIEVSGTIKTVEVDYNTKLTNGQVLARLDTTKLEQQALQSASSLEAARAKVAQAQATVQEAEAQWVRLNKVHELSGGKMPSQNDLDSAKATLARAKADEASAKASVTQWQATLDANRTDLSKAVIVSPINGVVLTRSVEPGQTVAAAFQSPTLFTLAEDLTQMELQVDVDEADVGQVHEGQDATFTVDAYPDRTFPARITLVRYGSQTVEGVVTYKTVLKVDNSSFALRPGMTATAVITVSKKDNVLLVPSSALRFTPQTAQSTGNARSGGLLGAMLPRPPQSQSTVRDDTNSKSKEQRVWTLRNGQLTAIPITKGATDGTMTEVVSGAIQSGVELVTDTVALKR